MLKSKRVRWLTCGILAAAVVAGVALVWLWPALFPREPDTVANRAARIWPGMTSREVEDILGVPPGNYSTLHELHGSGIGYISGQRPPSRIDQWRWDDDYVSVVYDADGVVDQMHYDCDSDHDKAFGHLTKPPSALDRLAANLSLP
jgi:hypothetical protein